MVTRITAEFDSQEKAEEALGKVRNSVKGVYSTNLMQSRISSRSSSYRENVFSAFMQNIAQTGTLMSAAINIPSHTYDTDIASNRRKTTVFIVCDGSSDKKIHSLLEEMGGKNINKPVQVQT